LIRIWNVERDHIEREFSPDLPANGCITSLVFSPSDDKRIAWTTSKDLSVHVGDWEGSYIQSKLSQTHTSIITSVAFSPDGSHVVVGGDDGTVAVYNATTMDLAKGPFTGDEHGARSVAFSAGDEHGARSVAISAGDEHGARSVAFSAGGSYIISHSNVTVRIRDAETGHVKTEVQILGSAHRSRDKITTVAFSPDSKRFASGTLFGMLQVWSVDTGNVLREQEFSSSLSSVAFSPDGKRITAGFAGGVVKIMDTALGCQWTSKAHSSSVGFVAFSSDNSRLVSASETRICVWDTKVADETFAESRN
jgi:WD40 repeat protein